MDGSIMSITHQRQPTQNNNHHEAPHPHPPPPHNLSPHPHHNHLSYPPHHPPHLRPLPHPHPHLKIHQPLHPPLLPRRNHQQSQENQHPLRNLPLRRRLLPLLRLRPNLGHHLPPLRRLLRRRRPLRERVHLLRPSQRVSAPGLRVGPGYFGAGGAGV
ncbi:hypothetical protein B0T16DRAFT_443698 [Cercophora newfieldiana]|uniref:Uncharacterized protein n=1 Tax=Cercophora newfieldiana TaxID=92897 RepID=A0AA39YH67_9PEZI|nr:hypothetical protein B0T16DRAFT_443698 [Cercophora newfieldiana]